MNTNRITMESAEALIRHHGAVVGDRVLTPADLARVEEHAEIVLAAVRYLRDRSPADAS